MESGDPAVMVRSVTSSHPQRTRVLVLEGKQGRPWHQLIPGNPPAAPTPHQRHIYARLAGSDVRICHHPADTGSLSLATPNGLMLSLIPVSHHRSPGLATRTQETPAQLCGVKRRCPPILAAHHEVICCLVICPHQCICSR